MLKPATTPEPVVLEGHYCRLEPLAQTHAQALYAAICDEDGERRHKYLLNFLPASLAELKTRIEKSSGQPDPINFAVLNKATGLCGGRQSLMRIRPEHASIEVGSIIWGRGIARTRIATEALYLTARHIFEDLGNRRFEWKCNNLNEASKRAALRFGFTFEGVFRQDLIVKNANRDTAWFSMLDNEWPSIKPHYQAWLDPDNFETEGLAKTSLVIPRGLSPV